MDYTDVEKQTLAAIRKANFKNLSKSDAVSLFSQLNQLRPDVAKEVLKQYPEFASLIRTTMEDYKDLLSGVISSDDNSLGEVYKLYNKDLDTSLGNRNQFYGIAEQVQADLSKCLDNPDLTTQERNEILSQEMEILRVIDKKDTEIRKHEEEVIKLADKKDSEKRQFNWSLIRTVSGVIVTVVGIGAAVLGSNIDLKLPQKKEITTDTKV